MQNILKKHRKNLAISCLLVAAFLVTRGIGACQRGYPISGTVDGDVLAGIPMNLSGDDNATATTAVDGSCQFTVLQPDPWHDRLYLRAGKPRGNPL